MKITAILTAILLVPFISISQLHYSKVKIYASNAELFEISNLGVTIDHGKHKSDHWFITDLSSLELDILRDNGVIFETLIEDVSAYYAEHAYDAAPKSDREDCPGFGGSTSFEPGEPENFELGSMGGYFTYEEFLAELDAMHEAYPDLITEKEPIPGFETWEGRPIHWVRLSDNPEVDEEEHEVLYTSIHHAREPMSLSQTIFYMWYLLENYGTDDEISYLVNETEMYFVPMINPDGYKHNHTTNPDGGGMHRKNRNPDIGDSNAGVDLNRNYSYHWNEAGTSPYENSDVFAGESAFSEPETQAIKWFCENHNFQFAFNAHSHGDLLLFPFGWDEDAFADDHDYFARYSSHMTIYNSYAPIKATNLYPAAGISDDWMYEALPGIFAMTPEVGDSFWPSGSAIVPTCKEMIWPNKLLAHLPHVYGLTTDLEASRILETTGHFNYKMERLGQEDGSIEVSMTALTGIVSLGDANEHLPELMEIVEDSISFELDPDIAFGDEIKYIIHTDNGMWTKNDTVTKSFGFGTAIFFDDCSDLFHWIGDWNFTNETFYSPAHCITDSPYDNTYGNNLNKEIELDQGFDLEHSTYASVNFHAKWEIENNYDYVQFMASVDGGDSWEPLCGRYTNTGVPPQDEGEPLYDGVQNEWVREEIDLSDYLGEGDVRFKFRLISDEATEMDGFYFDDFVLYSHGETAIDGAGLSEYNKTDFKVYPNPANHSMRVKHTLNYDVQSIVIYDELGKAVKELNGNALQISVHDLSEGIYFIQLKGENQQTLPLRFTVIR